jgi:hypothetical protein
MAGFILREAETVRWWLPSGVPGKPGPYDAPAGSGIGFWGCYRHGWRHGCGGQGFVVGPLDHQADLDIHILEI